MTRKRVPPSQDIGVFAARSGKNCVLQMALDQIAVVDIANML
jgi:hypothetical protein